jgi:hypothetical protein
MNSMLLRVGALALLLATASLRGQGTFQNLDFEEGSFVPIPGDPYGRVQFGPAMPGWTGYIGTNQIDWILHNNKFLSYPGIGIQGPDYPSAGLYHGQYFVTLQNSFPPTAYNVPSLVQTGMVPPDAKSISFITTGLYVSLIGVSFRGVDIPLYHLATTETDHNIWGGDTSAFAGQTGELRLWGGSSLDYVQFSSLPIPEPNAAPFFALGALLLARRRM